MASPEERRSFLLSMTLTELALLLFFLLLLLAAIQLLKKNEIISQQKRVIDKVRETVGVSTSAPINENDDIWTDLCLCRGEEHECPRELRDREKELEDIVDEIERITGRRPSVPINPDDDIWTDLCLCGEEEHECLAKLRNLEKEMATTRRDISDCQGRFQNCRNELVATGGGRDHPPCWAQETTGKIEYIYEVEIREADLSVRPYWPPHRERQVSEIEGALQLVEESQSAPEFSRRAAPILAWSKKQEPECRHYVRIVDSAETKDSYKEKRWLVENFFYKYEVRP